VSDQEEPDGPMEVVGSDDEEDSEEFETDVEGESEEDPEGSSQGVPEPATTSDTPPAGELTPPHTMATSTAPVPGGSERGPAPASLDDEAVAEQVANRVEGRTSDAKTRSAEFRVGDTPPDKPDGDAKSTDAGNDLYPFPVQGDVDIATIPRKDHDGEFTSPIPLGAWVQLGEHPLVPERLVGRIAYVTSSPTILCNCNYAPRTHEHQAPDASITVQTRDEVGATLSLPREAFLRISVDGRHGVAAYG
jgi:hypothetical protein